MYLICIYTGDLSQLRWTLVDHIEVTEEQLTNAGHQGEAKCRCSECIRLKTIEDNGFVDLIASMGQVD